MRDRVQGPLTTRVPSGDSDGGNVPQHDAEDPVFAAPAPTASTSPTGASFEVLGLYTNAPRPSPSPSARSGRRGRCVYRKN